MSDTDQVVTLVSQAVRPLLRKAAEIPFLLIVFFLVYEPGIADPQFSKRSPKSHFLT